MPELELQLGELALDVAVLFLGEVVLGVLRKIAQARGLADTVLHVQLSLVEVFALGLESGLFLGADDLHGLQLLLTFRACGGLRACVARNIPCPAKQTLQGSARWSRASAF